MNHGLECGVIWGGYGARAREAGDYPNNVLILILTLAISSRKKQ